jgi:RHS repeat-associated protein
LEYNSFGKIISATKNDSSLQFAYTGKLTDKEIDLQWNINRWYDAKIGRWVSEDPIGFEAKDINLYRYLVNIPIYYVDFIGHEAIAFGCGFGAIGGFIGGFAAALANTWNGQTFKEACRDVACNTAANCVTGALTTGLAAYVPILAPFSGCIGAAVGNALNSACQSKRGDSKTMDCSVAVFIADMLVGCAASYFNDVKIRKEATQSILIALGIDIGAWSSVCYSNPHSDQACCTFKSPVWGTYKTSVDCASNREPGLCCNEAAIGWVITAQVMNSSRGACQ